MGTGFWDKDDIKLSVNGIELLLSDVTINFDAFGPPVEYNVKGYFLFDNDPIYIKHKKVMRY